MHDTESTAEITETALRLLARREHSTLELTRKLRKRGFSDRAIAEVLERLASEGAIDEARMAEQYVGERAAKGFGPLRIRADLLEKGLPESLIDPLLEAVGDDWDAYLAEICDRRYGSAPPSNRDEYGRRGRFLEQRGFPAEMIRRFLRWPD